MSYCYLLTGPLHAVGCAGEARDVVVFSGNLAVEEIRAFVRVERLPLTVEFNPAISRKIVDWGMVTQVSG